MSSGLLSAQTATVPDSAFKSFLHSQYPATLDGDGELIVSKAADVRGILDCSRSNIVNLEGIQYFTQIHTLYCFKNKLTTLPDMSGMTNLLEIHAYDNALTSVPSFNKLTQLRVLILGHNRLRHFPEVDSLKHLLELFIYGNEITQVPDLVHLTSLQKFHCYSNKLVSLGKMPASLQDLVFSNNLLTEFPDISQAKGLLNIGGHTNRLTNMPNLTSYASLQECVLHKNLLTFEDLIPSSLHQGFGQWEISPQDSLPVVGVYRALKNESLKISLLIDTASVDLTYTWYHNGVLRAQTLKPILEIKAVQQREAGSYVCKVTSANPAFSSLTLTTQAFTVVPIPDFTVAEDLSLTPNGDGKNDELYFEERGQLSVFDSRGKLVDQQVTPCYWNGTSQSGIELGTGFYLLKVNDTVYRITIIR
ncbi:MAG TPA: gliding motility-associated C-terminal domain-containing protein [Cytophagales bacterium]|nr:gliding motility-associated C-terminal domain-containing protein [Cytophagales bacterium]